MHQKIFYLPLILLLASFVAGIFTQILVPAQAQSLPIQSPSVMESILAYLKSDILTVTAALVFSVSVFLLPLVPLMIIGKTFSLGFSAAYMLSSSAEKGLGIVMAALVPRGMFKLPAYIALAFISLKTASFIRRNYQNPSVLHAGGPSYLLRFFYCFLALAASSVLEALLLQGVL